MTQVHRTPLADQVSRLLLDRIKAGEWELGAKLPGEATLAPQLGVGRSTVREAIRQLAGQGVLSSRQGAGVFVAALDVARPWQATVKQADIIAIIEARMAIETEAAALAARKRTVTDLQDIRKALEERKACRQSSIEAHVDSDTHLHRCIVVAAHNALLIELFDSFTLRCREAMVAMLRMRKHYGTDDDHDSHVKIVSAIEGGDDDAAARYSRAHLMSLKRWLQ